MIGGAPTEARTTPYKGLTYYTEADEAYFFGRDIEREIIIANLKARRLMVLYGASGVGKSSLLRAGVVSGLRRRARRDAANLRTPENMPIVEYVPVVFSTWRDDPITGLAEAMSTAIRDLVDEGFELPLTRRLGEMIDTAAARVNGYLLIVLDQFEEYFLYHPNEAGSSTFADEFVRAVNRPGLAAGFLMSIREDALAKLDRFKRDIPKLFESTIRVAHLDTAAAREAIRRPIDRYNELTPGEPVVILEDALVDKVLEQVRAGQVRLEHTGQGTVTDAGGKSHGDDEIETPYLQLVMTRLWEEEMSRGSRRIRLATLTELGGATEVVRTHLDAELSDLASGERDVAADIFHHLVTPSGTKIAHSVRDLAQYSRHHEAEIQPLLEKLAAGEARIVRGVPTPSGGNGPARFEIFHDVLAPAILDWRERRAEARMHRRIRWIWLTAAGLVALAVVAGVILIRDYRNERNDAQKELSERRLSDAELRRQLRKFQLAALTAVPPSWKLDASHVPGSITASGRPFTDLTFTRPGKAPIRVRVDSTQGSFPPIKSLLANELQVSQSRDYRRIKPKGPLTGRETGKAKDQTSQLLEWVFLVRNPDDADFAPGQLERRVDFFFNAGGYSFGVLGVTKGEPGGQRYEAARRHALNVIDAIRASAAAAPSGP